MLSVQLTVSCEPQRVPSTSNNNDNDNDNDNENNDNDNEMIMIIIIIMIMIMISIQYLLSFVNMEHDTLKSYCMGRPRNKHK